MKQTSVEWLIDEIPSIDWENSYWKSRLEQAKEFEKQMLFQCWKASEQNMRSQFSSSAYKNVMFEEWFEQFKKK
jgi:hypothetical protein